MCKYLMVCFTVNYKSSKNITLFEKQTMWASVKIVI